jgi:predicted Rossmann fold nucleotide-binding protein DprA/Smf involved in DNA uptake
MKIIIAGTRTFNNYQLLKEKCNHLLSNQTSITIISGTAKGADKLGEQYAKEQGHSLLLFPPLWDTQGKQAGIKRNIAMAQEADALIAFWDGKSKGTKHMIQTAREKGLPVRVIYYPRNNL